MNLLQRSLNSQGGHQASSAPTSKKSTFSTNSTNTHVLFHLNSPYSFGPDSPPPPSQFFTGGGGGGGRKNKTSKMMDLQSVSHSNASSTPSFDYYEYFSNYGRVLASPPVSPLDSGSAFCDPQQSPRDSGFKRFWRRNSPQKLHSISMPGDSGGDRAAMERSSRDTYLLRSGGHSGSGEGGVSLGSPRIQRQSSSGKSFYRLASSPNSPGLYSMSGDISPLVPSRDPYAPLSPLMGLNDIPCRISFIETNLYIPIDLPQSEHIAPRPYRHHHFLHQEWVHHTVAQLKSQFKSTQVLVNVERKARYPFVIYGSPGPRFDPSSEPIVPTAACSALSPELRIFDGLYDICASITRPGSNHGEEEIGKPLGYIICAFQTFPGEDSEKLERNWIVWTGAAILYKQLPMSIGLRRLIFFKRHDLHLLKSFSPQNEMNEIPIFTYVLLCECVNLRDCHLATTCSTIDQLRARCCGYSGLYINYT